MAEYLVELYVAQGDQDVALRHAESAEQAGAELTREGRPVRCLRSIFVPEDETCFLLFDAASVDLVAEAVHRAGLRHEHISAATSTTVAAASAAATHPKGTTMTITTQLTDYTELRDKQQKVWSSGDYNKIAALTVPVSEHLVEHVGVMPGERVLDVATGTGHVALAAARRSAKATGIDYVPELLDIARRRAQAEELDIELRPVRRRGPAVRRRDVRRGALGDRRHVRRRPRPRRSRARPVCRPGGRIGLASWTPEGFVGGMLAAVGRHVTPPAGAQPATRWGVEAVVAELLGDEVTDVASVTATVRQRFARPEDYADLFLTYYGPTFSAASRLDEDGRAALRADLIELVETFDKDAGNGVIVDWEYRIVTATRR